MLKLYFLGDFQYSHLVFLRSMKYVPISLHVHSKFTYDVLFFHSIFLSIHYSSIFFVEDWNLISMKPQSFIVAVSLSFWYQCSDRLSSAQYWFWLYWYSHSEFLFTLRLFLEGTPHFGVLNCFLAYEYPIFWTSDRHICSLRQSA